MLKNARKRCQATPIVRFRAITIAHTIDTTILIKATNDTAQSQAGSQLPSQVEIGAAHVGYGRIPLADWNPRIRKMQTPTARITDSTKYACQKFDPANRDFLPARLGWFSCRTVIRVVTVSYT